MVFKRLPEVETGIDGPHAIRRQRARGLFVCNSWMLAQTKNGARKNPGSV